VTEQKRYDLEEQTSQPHFGLVHAFYAIMGGFAFYGPYDDDDPTAEESFFQISTNPHHTVDVPKMNTIVYIVEHFPHILTNIPEEYILNQAVSSSLGKVLLIVQVAWFCTNCASRLFQHLPLSLLEVTTVAHGFCTLIAYIVWWSKPLNVAAPTILREREAQEVYALLKCSDDEYDKALEMAQNMAAGDPSTLSTAHGSEKIVLAADALQHLLPTPERPPHSSRFHSSTRMMFPGFFAPGSGHSLAALLSTGLFIISAILYGLVHVLAWGGRIPTPLERLLWQVSSWVVTCSGLTEILVISLTGWLGDNDTTTGKIANVFRVIMYLMIPFAHILASGFLIVESFRELAFLDSAAYQLLSWTNYWPHFS